MRRVGRFISDPRAGAYCRIPAGRAALTRLTRGARPESLEATPLGAFVDYVKDVPSVSDLEIRCAALLPAR